MGLVYDPFTNLLSANTRNGATLPMFIGKAKLVLGKLPLPALQKMGEILGISGPSQGVLDSQATNLPDVSKPAGFEYPPKFIEA